MEAQFECQQDQDSSWSVRHKDNHQIATLNNVELTGLDEQTAKNAKDELEIALLKMANGHEFDNPFDLF